jgi:hypothetical protein
MELEMAIAHNLSLHHSYGVYERLNKSFVQLSALIYDSIITGEIETHRNIYTDTEPLHTYNRLIINGKRERAILAINGNINQLPDSRTLPTIIRYNWDTIKYLTELIDEGAIAWPLPEEAFIQRPIIDIGERVDRENNIERNITVNVRPEFFRRPGDPLLGHLFVPHLPEPIIPHVAPVLPAPLLPAVPNVPVGQPALPALFNYDTLPNLGFINVEGYDLISFDNFVNGEPLIVITENGFQHKFKKDMITEWLQDQMINPATGSTITVANLSRATAVVNATTGGRRNKTRRVKRRKIKNKKTRSNISKRR